MENISGKRFIIFVVIFYILLFGIGGLLTRGIKQNSSISINESI